MAEVGVKEGRVYFGMMESVNPEEGWRMKKEV
jgi:hypothetical protein